MKYLLVLASLYSEVSSTSVGYFFEEAYLHKITAKVAKLIFYDIYLHI